MIELNDNTWIDFISKNEKVLVDVYGIKCNPCTTIASFLAQAESNDSNGVSFAKIEANMNVDSVAPYGISAVPTLLYFKSGKLIHKETGLKTVQEIQNRIQKYLL
jgi:thioredoxin 1